MSIARWFIGLASGSGGEGTDVALVEVTGVGLQMRARVVASLRRGHSRDLQFAFVSLSHSCSATTSGQIAVLHRQLGESAASAAMQLLPPSHVDAQRILAAGHIGPLVWHEPSSHDPVSIEIGQASIVAERTGLTIFSEFRERDVAAGGQGMPIAGLADWVIFRNARESRLLIHLGGTTSAVHIPVNARPQDVLAFEIGPGTRLLDAVIRQATGGRERCDVGGKHAVQGKCLDPLLTDCLEHPYLQRRPPKSLGRLEFGPEWVARAARMAAELNGNLEDLLCTLSHFVVRCIARAMANLPDIAQPPTLWLSGGGTRNGLLWRLLENELPNATLRRLDDLGVPAQQRQAAGAAILAALNMDGIPASSPGITGSVGRILGRVTPGEPRNWAQCLRWMSELTAHELTRPYKAA
jgi:anhydro-N-acetylmuramic acid kinase